MEFLNTQEGVCQQITRYIRIYIDKISLTQIGTLFYNLYTNIADRIDEYKMFYTLSCTLHFCYKIQTKVTFLTVDIQANSR